MKGLSPTGRRALVALMNDAHAQGLSAFVMFFDPLTGTCGHFHDFADVDVLGAALGETHDRVRSGAHGRERIAIELRGPRRPEGEA